MAEWTDILDRVFKGNVASAGIVFGMSKWHLKANENLTLIPV
jgi:hypothetical protein